MLALDILAAVGLLVLLVIAFFLGRLSAPRR